MNYYQSKAAPAPLHNLPYRPVMMRVPTPRRLTSRDPNGHLRQHRTTLPTTQEIQYLDKRPDANSTFSCQAKYFALTGCKISITKIEQDFQLRKQTITLFAVISNDPVAQNQFHFRIIFSIVGSSFSFQPCRLELYDVGRLCDYLYTKLRQNAFQTHRKASRDK